MATTLTSGSISNAPALQLAKYSLGMGDRFAHEAEAQLRACQLALDAGVRVTPVWNKSNREHTIIGSRPESVRAAAEAAIKKSGWRGAFHIDADHVNIHTVDIFLGASDFFTIDVADAIGKPVSQTDTVAFIQRHPELLHPIDLVGTSAPLVIPGRAAEAAVHKFLFAVREAGKTYRHILERKGKAPFITEVSMDETDSPQTPAELLIILAALADEGVPVQTIAPKFTGRFNKGVDYVGDVAKFEAEFRADLAVIARAIDMYGLPPSLKLSLHSGSDKFSIYASIARALRDFDAGIHVKTAGTTWLEELIGLAEAGGDGLALAKEISAEAHAHREELCVPYATVIDIDPSKLPAPSEVAKWTSEQYTSALRHDPKSPLYNRSLRQLLHVGFKVAAKMGDRYLRLLEECRGPIARNVTTNLFERHVKPIFLARS
jgi:tagaturonate epimerase